jgi:hypothetical protein
MMQCVQHGRDAALRCFGVLSDWAGDRIAAAGPAARKECGPRGPVAGRLDASLYVADFACSLRRVQGSLPMIPCPLPLA